MRFLLTTAAALLLASFTLAAEPPRVKGYVSAEEHEALKARGAELEKATKSGPCPCGAVCPCGVDRRTAVKAGPLSDPRTVRAEDYPYPDHIVGWRGVATADGDTRTPWGVSVCRACDYDSKTANEKHTFISADRPMYFNGERYDAAARYQFRTNKYDDEFTMWLVYTGPCRMTVRDGAYYFDSLTGDELEYRLTYGGQSATKPNWRADLTFPRYSPRLRTMSECRKVWAAAEGVQTSTATVAGDPPGSIRTLSGTLIRPKADGPGFEEVPGSVPLRTSSPATCTGPSCPAPSFSYPSYLPAAGYPQFTLPTGPATSSCPGGRCPIR